MLADMALVVSLLGLTVALYLVLQKPQPHRVVLVAALITGLVSALALIDSVTAIARGIR